MDWSLPGSPIHGIFQARILECGAISFSKGPCKHSQLCDSAEGPLLLGKVYKYPQAAC